MHMCACVRTLCYHNSWLSWQQGQYPQTGENDRGGIAAQNVICCWDENTHTDTPMSLVASSCFFKLTILQTTWLPAGQSHHFISSVTLKTNYQVQPYVICVFHFHFLFTFELLCTMASSTVSWCVHKCAHTYSNGSSSVQ